MRTWVICAGFMLLGGMQAHGQPTLLRSDEVLGTLYKQFGGSLPACPDLEKLRSGAREDIQWLIGRFKGTTVDPEYVASLGDLSDAVRKSAKSGREAACASLRLIAADLHVKRLDCRAVGHSRTNIRVEISTVDGQKDVPGWEVYARWLPAGDRFTTVPRRLQSLSSPARGTVPVPGEYEIYAQQSSSGVSTGPVRVSIGGAQVFTWPLPVPKEKRSEK
jgi:hypothetical protein